MTEATQAIEAIDQRQPMDALLLGLNTSAAGLSTAEAARRLSVYGPNELTRRRSRQWPGQLLAQFTQPLAVLLALAAALAWVGGTVSLSIAVIAVILLNAAFAFVQERQAEHAVEALTAFLSVTARVVRDGAPVQAPARDLVPGDLLIIAEGDRVSADARILEGTILLDVSALTGESMPVSRSADGGGSSDTSSSTDTTGSTDTSGSAGASGPAEPSADTATLLDAEDLVFSGSTCTGGQAHTVVTRTGMHTEIGRIATLAQTANTEPSPLERQIRRATWIIAIVAVVVGVAFLPLGLAAGLGWSAAISFAIGLLVANVPEGLLPTITLALAVGVRELAHRGAVVKKLSAVETLGSTTVICTDKTGTLTENRMRVTRLWLSSGEFDATQPIDDVQARLLAVTAAACTTAEGPSATEPHGNGDPTELAVLRLALDLDVAVDASARAAARRAIFGFDPHLERMSTVDVESVGVTVHTKGALEAVLPLCTAVLDEQGRAVAIQAAVTTQLQAALDRYAANGLRVLAIARRLIAGDAVPTERADAERALVLLGLLAMVDPPRSGVADAVTQAHAAGVRIHVVTGDYGPTAAEIARQVGIGAPGGPIIGAGELDALDDSGLDRLLADGQEIVFARTAPEGKLRICRALRTRGEVVAMTGDGVNDAPALRHADIGVAMGLGGTDVAREAATMVLTDDNFATIVAAIDEGRRVFDNVRKFVLYIFAHAVPEVVPFLIFALSGGSVPLPLTVLQILAIDLGTETLPALALGREPAEPGLMNRPPRPRGTGVIDRALLIRAWAFLGTISAVLVMGGFFFTLWRGGWHPGDPTGAGTALHHVYRQATTITFAGIAACQIGTAFAARTDRVSLFTVGVFSNPLLLAGIVFEIVFTAAVIYLPMLQGVFGTASLSPAQLLIIAPFPLIVWGADETARWVSRRRRHSPSRRS